MKKKITMEIEEIGNGYLISANLSYTENSCEHSVGLCNKIFVYELKEFLFKEWVLKEVEKYFR